MIKKTKIRQAVEIVRELNLQFQKDASKKKNLLEDDNGGLLFLQISLKKVPNIKNIKMIKMPLPNSIPLDSVCLITGDLDKKNHKADIEPDILHYKELLSNCGISSISEVITLRQLRTDYKSYEARQLLLGAFDTFIADKKIAGPLPKVLGRHFFKKRKFPIKVDLKSKDLKRDIEYALSERVLFVSGHGNSCALEVAHLDMEDSKITENVMAAVNTLSEKLPGSWDNIMGLYLRIARSKAIPIYMSYDDASNVKFDAEKEMDITVDELSTLRNASVRVYSDGKVECTRKVEHLKTEDLEEDVSSAEEEEIQNSRKKKKRFEKNSLPECDQLNDGVVKCEIDENISFLGGSGSDEQVVKKTPGGKTPKGKQQNDKGVSLQIPGKNTPAKKTPKGENALAKKQLAPGKKINLKEFPGIMTKKSDKKNGTPKRPADDDDDNDDDNEDDDDNDDEEDGDLDMLLGGDDDDDDDDEDDDDDDEDDDDEEPPQLQQKKKQDGKKKQNEKQNSAAVQKQTPAKSNKDAKNVKKQTPKQVKNQSPSKAETATPDFSCSPPAETTKMNKSKKKMNRNNAMNNPDSEDSQAKGAKKLKKSQKQNVQVEENLTFSNDSEGLHATKSLTATKKIKISKKEATNERNIEFFPDNSEDPETVNSAMETKKLKKNKKQVTSMTRAELFSNQSKDSSPIKLNNKSRKNLKKEMNDRVSQNSINEPFNQTKKPNKRKRVDSELASADIKENKFEFKSPIQAQKKKRLEDNVKHNLAMKKARRNKMKENRLKSK